MNNRKIIVTVLIYSIMYSLFAVICLPISISEVTDLYVGGGQTYITIQSAINDANESDIIHVLSGTYNENLIINKNISIIGENRDNTIIHGSNGHTIKIHTSSVNISGLTIKNTGESYFCIYLEDSEYCNLKGNLIKKGGYGIYLDNSNFNNINDNIIQENNVGIKLRVSNGNIIKNNDIKNNNANGVFIYSSSNDNIIYLNHFSDNLQSNARDSCSNIWSYNSQGNYWDDYNNYDNNSDGVGDKIYEIDYGGNTDDFPLGYFKNNKPEAFIVSINPISAMKGEKIDFNGHGTDDSMIIEWEWRSSKDGFLSGSEDFSTTNLRTGTHTIYFRVKDDDNDWSDYDTTTITISEEVEENKKPTANIISINPGETIKGVTVYFHGIGLDSDGIITKYKWRSNIDGFLSDNASFTKSDISVGNHKIYFKVCDNNNEWSSEVPSNLIITSDSSILNDPPIPDAGGPYFAYVNDLIIFDGSLSFDSDGEIVSYNWILGDGNTSTGKLFNYSYHSIGNYSVSLTILDDMGKESTVSTFAYVINNSSDQANIGEEKTGDIPGFEFLIFFGSIFVIIFKKRFY